MQDRIEVGAGGTSYVGEKAVDLYRMQTLARGLRMELRGMRLTRKVPTCYSIIKREYGLKGNKQRVLDQFLVLLLEAAKTVPVVER